MLSFIQGLFANKLLHDDREPFLYFTVLGIDGKFAVLAPRLELWIQLVHVRSACIRVGASFAVCPDDFCLLTASYSFYGYKQSLPVALQCQYTSALSSNEEP